MLMSTFGFWLLLGIVLLLSELFLPGLIAAFFGIGALVVGLLTLLGLVESFSMQLVVFSVVSLVALFSLRHHFRRWLMGAETGRSAVDLNNAGLIGSRVSVLTDFVQGSGDVQLNGAKWDAESDEPLKAGDSAWVVQNRGILLIVSASKPTQA